jgi:hypothetical protein
MSENNNENNKFIYEHEKFVDKSIKKYYELLNQSNINGCYCMQWLNIFDNIKINNKNINILNIQYWDFLGEYFYSNKIYCFNIKNNIKNQFIDWYNTFGMEFPERNNYYSEKQKEINKIFIEKFKKFEEETLIELSKLPGSFNLKLERNYNLKNGNFNCETARKILQLSLGDKLKTNNECNFSWKN